MHFLSLNTPAAIDNLLVLKYDSVEKNENKWNIPMYFFSIFDPERQQNKFRKIVMYATIAILKNLNIIKSSYFISVWMRP